MYYDLLFLQTASIQENVFNETDLGKLYRSIPFKELASKIPSPPQIKSGRGRNEKNHYLLSKVKAKTEATEIAWIFFGMMIANSARQGNAGKISLLPFFFIVIKKIRTMI